MRIHLVEELEGRWQLRQQRARVTQVHGRHIAALEGLTKLSAIPLLCGLQTGVLMDLSSSARARAQVSAAKLASVVIRNSTTSAPRRQSPGVGAD